jgi:SMC interacting uncharacterized protein involved in chromosome segregation
MKKNKGVSIAILPLIVLCVILVALCLFFFVKTASLQSANVSLSDQLQKKEQEVTAAKGLADKAQADQVSYDAMAKRIEMERGKCLKLAEDITARDKRIQELQDRLERYEAKKTPSKKK